MNFLIIQVVMYATMGHRAFQPKKNLGCFFSFCFFCWINALCTIHVDGYPGKLKLLAVNNLVYLMAGL